MVEKYRTTLILDEYMHKKIKKYQLENHKSMRKLIYSALDEYFLKQESIRKKIYYNKKNKFVDNIIFELERCLASDTARTLLEEKCTIYGIKMDELSTNSIIPELIHDICNSIKNVANKEDVQKIEEKLQNLL